jgi:hypothetical protein
MQALFGAVKIAQEFKLRTFYRSQVEESKSLEREDCRNLQAVYLDAAIPLRRFNLLSFSAAERAGKFANYLRRLY